MGRLQFLVMSATVAACSLVYELSFARLVSEMTGSPLIWESASVGVFLLGIGFRTIIGDRLRSKTNLQKLIQTETLLPALAVSSWFGICILQMYYRAYLYDGGMLREQWPLPPVFLLGIAAQPLIFMIGWCSGLELDYFLNAVTKKPFKHHEATVLASYHFGALVGTLAFVLSMRYAVSIIHVLCVCAGINLIVAMSLIRVSGFRRQLVAVGMGLAFVVACVIVSAPFEGNFLKNHYYNNYIWESDADGLKNVRFPSDPLQYWFESHEQPEVKRYRSPFQIIDIVTESRDELLVGEKSSISMYINQRFQISPTSSQEYHEFMTHVSLGYSELVPQNVIVLGGGDGALARELLKYDSISNIDVVEIDPVIIDMAKNLPQLVELNGDAFTKDRVKVVQRDAFRYMRKTSEKYDAIFIDLTYPFDFDSSKFYTVEFLRMISKKINGGGILVVGLPLNLVDNTHAEFNDLVQATLVAAGLADAVAFNRENHHFLVASNRKLRQKPQIAANLELARINQYQIEQLEARPIDTRTSGKKGRVFSLQKPDAILVDDPFY